MRPMCRVCDAEHFAREPHVFKVDPKPLHEVLRVAPVVVDKPKVVVDAKPVVVDKSRKSDRHAKVRTEYFREQKRKKRALVANAD